MDPSQIRGKIGRFRILTIGRANAGKTTILQRVCNTRDNPEIFNSAGEKIDSAVLTASRERGEHDIENEMVFQSNPGFVFHDSRGFEAGGESEFEKVKAFIAGRSKEAKLKDQLHAIWYCIPMDEASRSFTAGEVKFFSQCDTGSIPVMVLFTKFDALYDVEFAKLRKKGKSWKDAKELAPKHAEDTFANGPQLQFLKDARRPPKCHICLPNMDKDDADCGSLIKLTAETLDNEVLQQLFVSTQQTHLDLCMKYAVERTLPKLFDHAETKGSKTHAVIIGELGAWFPHIYVTNNYTYYLLATARDARNELGIPLLKADVLDRSHRREIRFRLLPVAFGSSPLENIVQLMSAAVIIFEHSFYIHDKRRRLRDQQESVPSFDVALEQYIASPHAGTVREAVSISTQAYQGAVTAAARAYEEAVTAAARAYEEAVTAAAYAYEEAVSAAVYTYQGNLPAWMAKFEPFKRKAKQSFERSKEKEKESVEHSQRKEKESVERSQRKEKESSCSKAKADFIKTILEITLNHRLPRP